MPKKSRKIPLKLHIHYAFDNIMSGGIAAVIGWLAFITLLFIFFGGLVVTLTGFSQEGDASYGFFEAAWFSLVRTLDAGTMGQDTGWGFRMVMLVVTLGGIFVYSTLIGILSNGIGRKIEELRKGRSIVLERRHIIILGWAPKLFSIISELIIANAKRRKFRIVVLAEKDKLEMQDEIKQKISIPKNTRIICRSGSPMEAGNLTTVNINDAKSVIILNDEQDEIFPVKALLAVINNPQRKAGKYNIVAEVRNRKNLATAKMIGGDEVAFVMSDELISRIVVQTCRYEGLSNVYVDLLNFSGNEIYFKDQPLLAGKSFGEALLAFDASSVIGLKRANGETVLNPPMDTRIEPHDLIIAIAEDTDSIRLSGKTGYDIEESSILARQSAASAPNKILVMGWNHRGALILKDLDNYLAAGSEVMVVAETLSMQDTAKEIQPELKNISVTTRTGDINDHLLIESLDVTRYDHLILLCYDDLSPSQADAKTLITLLHVRDIISKKKKTLNIVTEMADIQDVELAKITKEDDFIVSDILNSLLIAQLSENKELKTVFEQLFDVKGSELYVKSITDFVTPGKPVNFYTVVESARRQGQVVIGYRVQKYSTRHNMNYGIVLNPIKSNELTFEEPDKLIVIAEGG